MPWSAIGERATSMYAMLVDLAIAERLDSADPLVREAADEVRRFAAQTGGVVFERQLDERLAAGAIETRCPGPVRQATRAAHEHPDDVVEDRQPEAQAVERDPLVDAVESSRNRSSGCRRNGEKP